MRYGTQDNGPEPVAAPGSPDRPSSPRTNDEATPVQAGGGDWRQHVRDFYERNFGLFLVFSAQTFGSVVRPGIAAIYAASLLRCPFYTSTHTYSFSMGTAAANLLMADSLP